MEMMTNPDLVEKRKELKTESGQVNDMRSFSSLSTSHQLGAFDPTKSHVLPVIEMHDQVPSQRPDLELV